MMEVSGNFTSPGFPLQLPSQYVECDWVVKAFSGHKVILHFTYFDLPGPTYEGTCTRSFVAYGDFDDRGRRVVRAKLCGTVRPSIFGEHLTAYWFISILPSRCAVHMPTYYTDHLAYI